MTISTLPPAPLSTDTTVIFNSKAFNLVGALATFVSETNTDIILVNNIRIAAEAALDSFDDRYLGPKSVAPTLDNDGVALLVGALYWDTAIQSMRAYTGTVWTNLPAATAGAVANTPAGNIAATNVQAALNELDAEKLNSVAGAVLTANLADASVTTAKIANDSVTFAKMQNLSTTDRLIGRFSAGAGDAEEISCTAFARTLLDDALEAEVRETIGLGQGFGIKDRPTGQTCLAYPSNTDLNLCIQTGNFNFADTWLNKPSDLASWGYLQVARHSNPASGAVYVHQTAYDMNGTLPGAMWVRRGLPGTGFTAVWSPWVRLIDGTMYATVAGPSGNVLISNGAAWVSTPPPIIGVGINQSWQEVTTSRVLGTTYTNTTNRPIEVVVAINVTVTATYIYIVIGGVNVGGHYVNSHDGIVTGIVPAGGTYYTSSLNNVLRTWSELR